MDGESPCVQPARMESLWLEFATVPGSRRTACIPRLKFTRRSSLIWWIHGPADPSVAALTMWCTPADETMNIFQSMQTRQRAGAAKDSFRLGILPGPCPYQTAVSQRNSLTRSIYGHMHNQ